MKYGIFALRSCGERLYYCDSPTQGERMVPHANSIAYLFSDKKSAKAKLKRLQMVYHGLNTWHIFQAM